MSDSPEKTDRREDSCHADEVLLVLEEVAFSLAHLGFLAWIEMRCHLNRDMCDVSRRFCKARPC